MDGSSSILKNFRGGSRGIPNAEETATPALIRPGLRPAHLPPQGKALAYPVWPIVENTIAITPT